MKEYLRLLRPRSTIVESPASFWRRAFALIVDILIIDLVVTAPFTALFTPLVAELRAGAWSTIAYTSAQFAGMIVLALLAYAYFALFEYTLGQTPGMILADTRVRGQVRLWQAAVRNAFLIPLLPVILLWIVEPILIALRKESLLERLTGTRTIRTRQVII